MFEDGALSGDGGRPDTDQSSQAELTNVCQELFEAGANLERELRGETYTLPEDMTVEKAVQAIERLIHRRTLIRGRNELKLAANHNNSEYTSDYLEDRIEKLTAELAQLQEGGSKTDE